MTVAEVQKKRAAVTATSVTATYDSTPTAGNLLVAVYGGRSAEAITGPVGWTPTLSVNHASAIPRLRWFYKISNGTEGAVSCSTPSSSEKALQIFEHSSTDGWPADSVDVMSNGDGGGGNVALVSTGTTAATATANAVGIAGGTTDSAFTTYVFTNSYVPSDAGAAFRIFGSAAKILTVSATQETTFDPNVTDQMIAGLVVFKTGAAPGTNRRMDRVRGFGAKARERAWQ